MTGVTIDSEVTVTAGCAPSMASDIPPPLMLEVAATAQTATPGEAGATAEKVNTTLSPCNNAEAPPSAVRLIAVSERLQVHVAGVSIVTGGEIVNPAGIATLAEPRELSPVSVMVIENVENWLTFTSAGDITAVKE